MASSTATASSSSRLVDLLFMLPAEDRNYFYNIVGHPGLIRLSRCCRSLKASILDDATLWKMWYKSTFLSGVYYEKELDFVLWCARTAPDAPKVPVMRADLLVHLDWYSVYRRRVTTENNWRLGRFNTTRIDMEAGRTDSSGSSRLAVAGKTIRYRSYAEDACDRAYSCELPAISQSSRPSSMPQDQPPSAPSNAIPWKDYGGIYECSADSKIADHYIAEEYYSGLEDDMKIVVISPRGRGRVLNTLTVPDVLKLEEVNGRWALFYERRQVESTDPFTSSTKTIWANVSVADMEHGTMCPGSIDGYWDIFFFYQTDEDTATVYTVRVIKDATTRLEWALYQFSTTDPARQLRTGWFHLPDVQVTNLSNAYRLHQSRAAIKLMSPSIKCDYIVHSVASSGQSATPQYTVKVTSKRVPVSLLQDGFTCPNRAEITIRSDHPYDDGRALQHPHMRRYIHVIGSLYWIDLATDKASTLLVDIDAMETIRTLDVPYIWNMHRELSIMAGIVFRNQDEGNIITVHEYGAA